MSFAGKFMGATTPAQRKARKGKAASHSKPKQRAVLKDARGSHHNARASATSSATAPFKTRGARATSTSGRRASALAAGKARSQQRRTKGTGR